MGTQSLTDEENEIIRDLVRQSTASGVATQASVAARLGVTPSFLSQFLGGKKSASFSFAKKIAELIGLTVFELLAGDFSAGRDDDFSAIDVGMAIAADPKLTSALMNIVGFEKSLLKDAAETDDEDLIAAVRTMNRLRKRIERTLAKKAKAIEPNSSAITEGRKMAAGALNTAMREMTPDERASFEETVALRMMARGEIPASSDEDFREIETTGPAPSPEKAVPEAPEPAASEATAGPKAKKKG